MIFTLKMYLKTVHTKFLYIVLAEYSLEVIKDSAIDVAIIFGMDMSGLIADHCVGLFNNGTEQGESNATVL